MKHRSLRAFMKKKNLSKPFEYSNKSLIIDGLIFNDMYKNSGSPFILGGEYDRFASYIRRVLSVYIESNIQCYVIFSGAGKSTDFEKRKEIHQKIIDRINAVELNKENVYCEPIFVKDVAKDILNELRIKYYVCMYNSKPALFNMAKKLKCPILTNNIEYALYGVSVIALKSVVFNKEAKSISGEIYHSNILCRWNSFSTDIMSLMLTLTDEDSDFYNKLLDIFQCTEKNFISRILYWMRRQTKEGMIDFLKNRLEQKEIQKLLDMFETIRSYFASSYTPAMCALLNKPQNPRNFQEWFEQNVGFGNIPVLFINLKHSGILSGSWLVSDKNREDAVLPAVDIALYGQGLLRNTREVEIHFVGRKNGVSDVSVIKEIIDLRVGHRELPNFKDFEHFLINHLPFNIKILQTVPEDCWILLIALLYYDRKTNMDIVILVYCIILSYVLLGPVSEKVGVLKKSNFALTHGVERYEMEPSNELDSNEFKKCLTPKQCMQAANAVLDLFYPLTGELKNIFDRDFVHTLAEFQHCLQFINYLNRLCGGGFKHTEYHKAINCTFIYNLFVTLRDKSSPEEYIKKKLNCPEVFAFYKNILDAYFKCLG